VIPDRLGVVLPRGFERVGVAAGQVVGPVSPPGVVVRVREGRKQRVIVQPVCFPLPERFQRLAVALLGPLLEPLEGSPQAVALELDDAPVDDPVGVGPLWLCDFALR